MGLGLGFRDKRFSLFGFILHGAAALIENLTYIHHAEPAAGASIKDETDRFAYRFMKP